MLNQKLTGQQAADKTYIEDVFSTYLYTGNGGSQTINNGIDLAGKGGMVWTKIRDTAYSNALVDTNRGTSYVLCSDRTDSQFNYPDISSFNSNGYTIGQNYSSWFNASSKTYASWTFRKAPKFFDVVTYTGDGTSSGGRIIQHSLGVAPGLIIIKATSATGNWWTAARKSDGLYAIGTAGSTPFGLNSTNASSASASSSLFTSTTINISLGMGVNASIPYTNASGVTYVAYLFAHDTTTDGLIQCGSFTTDASGNANVTLGWEPQYLMFKRSSAADHWNVIDNMRGFAQALNAYIQPNLSSAESTASSALVTPTATGFSGTGAFAPSSTYIYMAIRRGPMRTPTDATKVFQPKTQDGTSPVTTGFVVDNQFWTMRDGSYNFVPRDRLRGGTPYLITSTTSAEASGSNAGFDSNTGVKNGYGFSNSISYYFQRAPGFFDVVCYTGTIQMPTTVSHNLKVAPELIIIKNRYYGDSFSNWFVYAAPLGANKLLYLNKVDAAVTDTTAWYNTTPTATEFKVDSWTALIHEKAVAYLFASCPGVSKVFSFTGNGSSQTINCGFTNGARLVLIKRTDSTGDWYVWDTARGIVAGNDPHLSLNTTAAEVTTDDTIDPESTGFIVNQVSATNVNVNGASYIGLAIA